MKKKIEEDVQKQSSLADEKKLEEQRISFSVNLIACLEDKKQRFNKENKSSIKIQQLKEVYKRGAQERSTEDLHLSGLARVNMFLRMNEQRKTGVVFGKTKETEKLSKLILETGTLQKNVNLIDISDSWAPQEEDFEEAKADTEKHNLNFNFKSINELYLEPYKPIQLDWD